jgi:hypothetical protein
MSNYKLVEVKFKDVVLGSVFYDPETASRYQKVDQPLEDGTNKYGNSFNVMSDSQMSQFEPDRIVKKPVLQ